MSYDLVADIGGTNMRVARVENAELTQRWELPMTPERDVARSLGEIAATQNEPPRAVIAAGAGPVIGEQIRLTNGGWLLCPDQIKAATGAQEALVINDFEAAAWFLASVRQEHVTPIGQSGPIQPGNRAVVGPGTGLGVGILADTPHGPMVVSGEGGHVALTPRDATEIPIFEAFIRLWPEVQIGQTYSVEAEGMISGTGLPLLYQACGGQSGTPAAEIVARAKTHEPEATMCLNIFRTHLASLCGNLSMTAMCKGGVFLVGGVAQANPWLFDQEFFDIFAAGGRFSKLRAECGVYLVNVPDFGLRGCANALAYRVSSGAR